MCDQSLLITLEFAVLWQGAVRFARSHVTLIHITSPTAKLRVARRDSPQSAWRNLVGSLHMNE